MVRGLVWFLAAAGVWACGSDDSDENCTPGRSEPCMLADGPGLRTCGADFVWSECGEAADGSVGNSPSAPVAPTPAQLTPCAAGWMEIDDEDGPRCEPYSVGGAPQTCGIDEAHFPGEVGCVRVGTACPAGDFPEGLPADTTVVYVRAGAAAGDGSSATPFGTIREARFAASADSVVAVGKGSYDEVVELRSRVTLWGACVAETTLTSSMPSDRSGVILVRGADSVVKNVRIAQPRRIGVWLAGSTTTLESVVIDRAEVLGIGVVLGGQLQASELAVRDTASTTDGFFGRGILMQDASSAEIRRAAFERNREIGLFASDEGSRLVLEDAVVHDTRSLVPSGMWGRGMSVQFAADAEVRRSAFVGNRVTGIFGGADDAAIAGEDIVVRGTNDSTMPGSDGRGVSMQEGDMAFERLWLDDNSGIAAAFYDATSQVTFADLLVTDTRSQEASGEMGRALDVAEGASVIATRSSFLRNRDQGMLAVGTGTHVRLEDLIVRDTMSVTATATFGRAGGGQGGATLEVVRASLENNRDIALYSQDPGTTLLVEDVSILGVEPERVDESGGRGLNAQSGSTLTARRVRIEDVHDLGVFAHGESTTVTLEDFVLNDVLPRDCFASGTCPTPSGMGLGTIENAALTATRFEVASASLCGVMLARGGEMDLSAGQVSGCAIGACVQNDGYDVERLTTEVRYFDNPVALDVTTLPVPDVTAAQTPSMPN